MGEINFFEEKISEGAKTLLKSEVKAILEAVLFATDEPIALSKLKAIVEPFQDLPPKAIGALLQEMRDEYASAARGFTLEEIAGGYLLRTKKEYAPFLATLAPGKRTERLSAAASEVLAIVAYKGPITRPQIEQIRGVDSAGSVTALLERGLIDEVGKGEGPGKPTLYGVTPRFLQLFGLKTISDLPKLPST
ncbi:MAG: SMC-Scp complex subunit ScpB [Parachlamydiales bacterium]